MWDVEGTYPDYKQHNSESNFYLKCDKTMFPGYWTPPINWSGYVNNVEVSFVQTSYQGSHNSDYNFTGFPERLAVAIPYIIEAIDEKMRVMD